MAPTKKSGMRAITSDHVDDDGARASLHCISGEIKVLDLVINQAALIQIGIIKQVGLIDILRLLQRLYLPIRIAPLILSDGDTKSEHLALLLRTNRTQMLSIALFICGQ